MKKLLYGVATFLLLFGFGLSQVNAQPVVVPNANEFVEGNSDNGFPFSVGSPMRYQQIYESTQFPECSKIFQINFRFDDDATSGGSATYPDILIQLSTTNVTPATLSTTFADNIGPDVTTVYDGELTFTAPDCGGGPCPFDNTITLQIPFNYNPSKGNLLLDVTEPTGVNYEQFDSVVDTPVVQRVWNAGDASAVTGTIAGDNGLVTQFVCEPIIPAQVPTLSEWGLISMAGILGIVGFMVIRRRKVTA